MSTLGRLLAAIGFLLILALGKGCLAAQSLLATLAHSAERP